MSAMQGLEVAKRYAAGESMQDIAADENVSRATLYRWMLAGQGDEKYQDLVTHCLVQRVAKGDAMIEDKTCDIARAREVARFARMDLERRRPNLYGAKQTLSVDLRVSVGERIQGAAAKLLENVVDEPQERGTGVMSNQDTVHSLPASITDQTLDDADEQHDAGSP